MNSLRNLPKARKGEGSNLLIVSSDALLRRRLVQRLSPAPGITRIHEATSRAELEKVLSDITPAVLLLDLWTNRFTMSESLKTIRTLSPATNTILLSESLDDPAAVEALREGAKGYCSRETDPDLLLKAIHLVRKGELWVRRKVMHHLVETLSAQARERGREAPATRRRNADASAGRVNDMLKREVKRITQALHDEAGQLVALAQLALVDLARELSPAAQERLREVSGLLDKIVEQLRRLPHELCPTILDDLGLVPALESLAQGISKWTGFHIAVDGSTRERLPAMIETCVYRIVQEALTNVTKHAQATHVAIRIEREARMIRCIIRDDGVGFDVASVLARRGQRALGLIGMQERVNALGGTLQITSAPGQGTELLITTQLET